MPRPARIAKVEETQSDLDILEYRKIPVRRFDEADLHAPVGADMLGSWLLAQMAVDFPHLSEAQLFGQLRMAIRSNEYLLVRSAYGVAMAVTYYVPLDPVPRVKVVGIYVREGQDDYWALVFAVLEWAKRQGASEVNYVNTSKRTSDSLRLRIPNTFVREVVYTDLR